MNQENALSVFDISQELNTGTAFTKFMLKRFDKFLSPDTSKGHPVYSTDAVRLLLKIKNALDSGKLPSQIELELENRTQEGPLPDNDFDTENNFLTGPNGDIRVSKDGLKLIKSLFSDIGEQQKRIAAAHEKRAEAEERKALAIEKRAEAEEKKASAMNNIASALQEMNRLKVQDPETIRIAHHAAEIFDHESKLLEDPDPDLSGQDNLEAKDDSDFPEDDLSNLLDMEPRPDHKGAQDSDDLNQFIEEAAEATEKTEDKNAGDMDDLSVLLGDEAPDATHEKLDDLNELIDKVSEDKARTDELDDLSKLIEDPADLQEMDDLSRLIDTETCQTAKASDMDDLSLLVELPESPGGTDDLSLLVDPVETKPSNHGTPAADEMDDLSLLVDDQKSQAPPEDLPMDDLSDLVDASGDLPPLVKPNISPQEDLEAYKAAIMKIIIELKSSGTTAEDAAKRLNREQILTLSGKPQWGVKALEQIYRFIESAS